MDDSLLAEFHAVFSVTGDVNSPTRPHPAYSSLYKQKRVGYGEQEARRHRMLEQQRSRRKDYADYVRKIADGEEWEEEMEDGEEGGDEVDLGEESSKKKKSKRLHPYRNQLMLSEWLVDVPPDFSENWLMTVCPVGKRSLVVANQRTTLAYSRSGVYLNCFPSLLPGGCKKTYHASKDYCILDCIYNEASYTYFVLDIMCWRGHPVYNTEREFRYYWLCTKLSEVEGTREISRINPYRFMPLDSFSCSKDSLLEVLSKPWPFQVDGLLFFHKHSHYTTGLSPLTVWLKPHMVADILSVPVAEDFLACAPRMADPLLGHKRSQQERKGEVERQRTHTEIESTAGDMDTEHSAAAQP